MTKFVGTLNIPSLASAPGTAQEGDLYYNTSTDKVNFYNGAAWTEVGGGGGNTVYYQTSAPGSANTGDIWIDSDSVLGGPIALTDSVSSTSTTTAATPNNVKSAYDLANSALVISGFVGWNFGASYGGNAIGNLPHYSAIANSSPTAGRVTLMRLVPWKNVTVSNIAIGTAAVSSSGLTLARFGIYTRSGSTFTLVARTASDTTIGNTSSTKYTRALDTTGGYPATYAMTAGSEYWVGFIFTGTTMPSILMQTAISTPSAGAQIFGYTTYFQNSQTDLPATVTGSFGSTAVHYIEVS